MAWPGILTRAAALAGLLACGAAQASPEALLARYQGLEPALAHSPFARPLVLQSDASASRPRGEVYALIDQPFERLRAVLRDADNWCDLLILPFNVKRCISAGPHAAPNRLQLAVGRKSEQPVQEAYALQFDYALKAADARYLAVQMSAAAGPLGTSDYQLLFEAVPLPGGRSFVHLSYAYAVGLSARLATEAYLATAGRHKIGFSVLGQDEQGQPRHVRGIQGVAERNTMRYFLAIESFLEAPGEGQAEQRLRDWFAATERYPQQLHEMEQDDYLAMKRKEIRQQRQLSAQAWNSGARSP